MMDNMQTEVSVSTKQELGIGTRIGTGIVLGLGTAFVASYLMAGFLFFSPGTKVTKQALPDQPLAEVITSPDQVIWNSQSANPLGSFPQSTASMNIDGSAFINSQFYAGPQYSGGNPINAILYVSGGSGRVGINTINPDTSAKLDVNGKMKATELCINGTCRTTWPSDDGGGASPIMIKIIEPSEAAPGV